MGFEAALQAWKALLKPGGLLAVSDLVWLKKDRPQAAIDFWTAYPDMTTLDARRQTVAANGYKLLGDFVLPTSAWTDEYYRPMQANIDLLRKQHAGNAEAEAVLAASEQEIRIFESSAGSYGYVFFVVRSP